MSDREVMKMALEALSVATDYIGPDSVTDKCNEAITAIRTALEVKQEPAAWESTTIAYTKFVSDRRYQKFSDAVKKHYKPYRCSSCAALKG